MPLFLLRDGSVRRCSVVPEGLTTDAHRDRWGRTVQVVLDAASEQRLVAAQPPRLPRRRRPTTLAA